MDDKTDNFVVEKNCLYKREEETGRLRYVVPKSMRKSIVVKFHDLMGHFSTDGTVQRILDKYWFGGMRRYVRQHIRRCPECVLTKTASGRQAGFLHPIPPARRPFEVIHIDHLRPFVKSSKGNCYILVAVDNLTKFVRLWTMRNTSAGNVIRAMRDLVMDYGAPGRIVSDRGTCFTSKQFATFCHDHGIAHTLTSVRHPQANGQVERVNRVLVPVIQASIEDDERKWDLDIRRVQLCLNTAINKTTGQTPFHMLHGFVPTVVDGKLRRLTEPAEPAHDDVDALREHVREKVIGEQEKWKERYDRRHFKAKFDVGEMVFVKQPVKTTGESTKLQPRFRGPLVVVAALPGHVYTVSQIRAEGERAYSTNAHVSSLKGFCGATEDDEEGSVSVTSDEEGDDGTEPSRATALPGCPSVSEL